ncbi:hypothetical protein OIV83_002519 [Microbotryomycetes sp. JL201]|nr:hypothetical protein OIV83_002519 [Microbotryomycetes sp. JL201]
MGLFSSSGDPDRDKPSGTSRLLRRKSQPRRQSTAELAAAVPSRRGSSLLDTPYSPESPSAAYEQPFTTSSTMASRRSDYYSHDAGGAVEAIDDGTAPSTDNHARQRPLTVDTGYRNSPPPHSTHSPASYTHERHASLPQTSSFQRAQPQLQQQRPQSQFIQPRSTSSPVGNANYGTGQQQGRPMSYMGPPSTHLGGGSGGMAPSPPNNMYSSSPAGSRSQLNQSPAPSSQGGGGQSLGKVPGQPNRQGSTSSRSTLQTSQPAPPPKAPASIGGEPLHDLGRAVALLKSSKFYAEGFLMKKVEVGPDGKAHPEANESQWAKWFVQLSGTILSTWNAADMEEAARQNRTVPPQYLNLSDAFLHPYPPAANRPAPTQFQFALNSAGLNRVLFCAPTLQSLNMWINAIRLAVWERSRCNEIYTGTLLGTREPQPNGWVGYDAGLSSAASKGKFEGWLKIRLPGDTEWRRLWTVVLKGSASGSQQPEQTKKNKRTSLLSFGKKTETPPSIEGLPGNGNFSTVAFYADKPTKKEQPLCIAQHLFYAAAIYPESEKLINRATLFKVEGTFLNPNDGYKTGWGVGGRAEKQGYALLMLEEGDFMGMLEWIVGLSDAFKLYGRPRGFSWDPRDPSSMYFALPIGPHRDRLFLDRELVDNLDITESRPRAVRAVFHNILFDRMRGVRSQPPPAQDVRAASATTDSVAPQLGPVETSAPIKIGNDQRSEDLHERGGYSSRTDSPSRRALAPVGESSTASNHESIKPAAGSSEQASWERQQQDLRDRERQWQDSQPQSSIGHGRNGLTAEYHAGSESNRRYSVMPLHDTNSPSMSDHAQNVVEPHTDLRADERRSSPPVVRPIETNVPNGNALNFSRPTQQMLSTSPTASAKAVDPRSGQYDGYHTETPAFHQTPAVALPSPGAPSEAVPSSPSTALGYLGASPGQAQGSFPGATAESADLDRQGMQHGSRASLGAGLAAGALGGAAVLGAHSLHQNHTEPHQTEPESQPSAPVSTAATPPRFTPERIPASEEPKSPREYQPLLDRSLRPPAPVTAAAMPPPTLGDSNEDAPEPSPATNAAAAKRMSQSAGSHGGDDIHSDLLAAINYVDRSSSPPLVTPVIGTPSTVEPSPVTQQSSQFHVGPPKRGLFANSPILEDEAEPAKVVGGPVETLGDEPRYTATSTAAPVSSTATPTSEFSTAPSSFPSSFAPNKRAEERLAAAKLAEQSQQAAFTRPGRQPGTATQTKSKAWVDSDDDEEEPEEDDSDDEPAPPRPNVVQQTSSFGQQRPLGSLAPNDPRRQSYLERGPSPDNRLSSLPPSPMNATAPLPASPSKRELDLRNESQGAAVAGNMKPVVSPHGLLHAGILDKEERSARALEHQAREGGGPLVNLPSKPPPPQTGLVGAITSLEREKERTGGVGRALTEQQRERKLAEQRQRQLDELQRQQLQMQMQAYQQMQMAQFGGYGMPGMNMGMGSMSGMPSMPWMVPPASGFGAFPGSNIGSPAGMSPVAGASPAPASPTAATAPLPGSMSMDAGQFQQHQQQMFAAQQAAQAAAQAAYMQAMASFSAPVISPGGSPPLNPTQQFGSMTSFPSMQFSQAGFYPPTSAPLGMPFNQFGGFNPNYQQQAGGGGLGMSGMGGANADADDEARGGPHVKQDSNGRVPPLSMPPVRPNDA